MTARVAAIATTRACTECGYRKTYRTPPLAAYHFPKHLCEKRHRAAATKARGDAFRASIDRTPKPCLHKVAQHAHATYACYVLDACRCPPCATAARDYERNRVRAHAYGRYAGLVDAEPARQHVEALTAAGVGLKRVAKVSGVAHGNLWKLMYGKRRPDGSMTPSRRVRWETAVRIMVVPIPDSPTSTTLSAGASVPAVGTRRRLQALLALGWSQSKLGERLGVEPGNFTALMKQTQVSARRARAVAALYDQLWNTPAVGTDHRSKISVSRALGRAAKEGWLPPMAWADADIDDPAAHPNASGYDSELVEAVMAGALLSGDEDIELGLTRVERVEILRRGRLAFAWHSTAQIAQRLGLDASQLYNDLAHQRRAMPNMRDKLPPVEDLQFLLDSGLSIAAIADRYGVSEDGVLTALRRHTAA